MSKKQILAFESFLNDDRKGAVIVDSDSLLESALDFNQTKISVWQGDISLLKVDSIVNAANQYMVGCFTPFHACIDNVIHYYGGPTIRLECEEFMKDIDLEPLGTCRITTAGVLPSKFVLHTVGPDLRDFNGIEQPDLLSLCYSSCLNAIDEHADIESIAFCCISTGIFRYPKEAACKVALRTTRKWLEEHPKSSIKHIVFNTFDSDSTNIYETNAPLFLNANTEVPVEDDATTSSSGQLNDLTAQFFKQMDEKLAKEKLEQKK